MISWLILPTNFPCLYSSLPLFGVMFAKTVANVVKPELIPPPASLEDPCCYMVISCRNLPIPAIILIVEILKNLDQNKLYKVIEVF
jgi:hypothetical protein